LIPYVRDGDVQIQTDGLCPFENENPTGNLKNRRRFTQIQRIKNPFDQQKSASKNIVNMLAVVDY